MTELNADELRVEKLRSRRREQILEGENEVLKMIIEKEPLLRVLNALTRVAERQSTAGLLASILLLDSDKTHLRHGAAPSLPAAYSQAIDGIAIGPNVGSCGTAAYRAKPVVVSDISSDPLWADFRDLATKYGLRACWSTPILSSSKAVLGTFALYYRHPCLPDEDDEAMISILTRTAALAIEHDRSENELAESEERLRSLIRCAPVGVFMLDAAGAFSYVNPRFIEMSGYEFEKTFDYWLDKASGRHKLDECKEAVAARLEYIGAFTIPGDRNRNVILRMAPMTSRIGIYMGYVGTLEDVSGQGSVDAGWRQASPPSTGGPSPEPKA